MNKARIIFMGTPDFAVGILDKIYNEGHEIAAVITAPDKPAGRGQKILFSAVKEYAISKNLPLLQPTNLKDENFIKELKSYNANLQIVVAFRMLPKVVWAMPKLGTFNLHASLLPQYRGAAPINWAIINGETKTGVTTFFIDDKIDTGAIIESSTITIDQKENVGSLHDKLMKLGAELVISTISKIENNEVSPKIQEESLELKTAYKLNKENTKINWDLTGNQIYNLIRGLCPHPTAWTTFIDEENEWNIKLFEAEFESVKHNLPINKVITTKKTMKIATNDGFLHILELQFPGKKKMKTSDLLNGIQFSDNTFVK